MSTNAAANTSTESPSFSITFVVTVLLLLFFFAGFFSICFCKCFFETMSRTWYSRRSPSGNRTGLDPSITKSFPTFPYSEINKHHHLECAICLCDFAEHDMLRLLSSCCHVFHQDCIDLWLSSHKTCPVCRKNLEADYSPLKCPPIIMQRNPLPPPPPPSIHTSPVNENEKVDSFSITINSDLPTLKNFDCNMDGEERFSKSCSTGHSIIRIRGENEDEKYTLQLPEDVQAKIVEKGLRCTKSCTAIGAVHVVTINGGFGEVSEEAIASSSNQLDKV